MGESVVVDDDESTRVVYHGNTESNRSQSHPPSSNVIITSSQSVDEQSSTNIVRRMVNNFISVSGSDSGSNNPEVLISATLVQDEGDVVAAETVGFFEGKWKLLALMMCVLLSFYRVWALLTQTDVTNIQGEEVTQEEEVPQEEEVLGTSEPSLSPSLSQ